jgi:hypothetical protein
MRWRLTLASLVGVATLSTLAWFLWQREAALPSTLPRSDRSSPPPESPPPVMPATRQPMPAPDTPSPKLEPLAPPATAQVEPEEGQQVPSRLFGRIINAQNHVAVGNVAIGIPSTIDLARSDGSEASLALDKYEEVSRSDVDGLFSIRERAPHTEESDAEWNGLRGSVLIAVAPGYGPVVFHGTWLSRDSGHSIEIPIVPSGILQGRLFNRTSALSSGVTLSLSANGYAAGRPTNHEMDQLLMLTVGLQRSFDEEGHVKIDSLPAGVPFNVEIWATGTLRFRDPKPLVLDAGTTTTREWRLGGGCVIRGRVIDQNEKCVPNQELWLTQRGLYLQKDAELGSFYRSDKERITKSVTTTEDGGFDISDVAPGTWWFGFAALDHSWDISEPDRGAVPPIAKRIDIRDGDSLIDVTLRANRGIFISGNFIDPDGKPATGFISASSMIPGLIAEETTQPRSDGSFVLGPLEPGDYEVTARPSPFRDEGVTFAPSKPIVVAAGKDDVRIELLRGGTIRPKAVRATTAEEVPAAFCLAKSKNPVILYGTNEYSPEMESQFAGLSPDMYDVAAITPDGMTGCLHNVVLEAGRILEDLRIPVEPGARVSLRYVGHEPEYANASIWVGTTYFGGDGIHAGTERTMIVPRGKVVVRWRAGAEQFDESIDLAVAETRELSWPRPK